MSRPDFDRMRNELLRSGVAAGIAARTVAELRDHYDDIEEEALAAGDAPQAAGELASRRLGQPDVLIAAIASRQELRSWIYRYPRLARVVLPLTCVVLLPVIPVFAGVANLSTVLRWLAALLLSGLITAMLMLVL
ncbi:MAG TPA: hypothetical protein VLB07_01855, partial [Woeseiaceae bacterium]|nr:hypothetical protein [Woeseiaceae bacterium]